MQKLISIYVDITGYDRDSGILFSYSDLHLRQHEHLNEYLSAGWKVVHLECMKGPGTGGWIVATIEHDNPPPSKS